MNADAQHHVRDGLFATRLDGGAVQLRATGPREITIPAIEWASLVAAVSAHGENAHTAGAALSLHDG